MIGATIWDILIGLLVGNVLAILSFWLITAPIAVKTRLSLYTYLQRIGGDSMARLYNWANVIIFSVISAAMITVPATAVRILFGIPAQAQAYPTAPSFCWHWRSQLSWCRSRSTASKCRRPTEWARSGEYLPGQRQVPGPTDWADLAE